MPEASFVISGVSACADPQLQLQTRVGHRAAKNVTEDLGTIILLGKGEEQRPYRVIYIYTGPQLSGKVSKHTSWLLRRSGVKVTFQLQPMDPFRAALGKRPRVLPPSLKGVSV